MENLTPTENSNNSHYSDAIAMIIENLIREKVQAETEDIDFEIVEPLMLETPTKKV